MADAGVGFQAFRDSFWAQSRLKMTDGGVEFRAFRDSFWAHSRLKIPDFRVYVTTDVVMAAVPKAANGLASKTPFSTPDFIT